MYKYYILLILYKFNLVYMVTGKHMMMSASLYSDFDYNYLSTYIMLDPVPQSPIKILVQYEKQWSPLFLVVLLTSCSLISDPGCFASIGTLQFGPSCQYVYKNLEKHYVCHHLPSSIQMPLQQFLNYCFRTTLALYRQ